MGDIDGADRDKPDFFRKASRNDGADRARIPNGFARAGRRQLVGTQKPRGKRERYRRRQFADKCFIATGKGVVGTHGSADGRKSDAVGDEADRFFFIGGNRLLDDVIAERQVQRLRFVNGGKHRVGSTGDFVPIDNDPKILVIMGDLFAVLIEPRNAVLEFFGNHNLSLRCR